MTVKEYFELVGYDAKSTRKVFLVQAIPHTDKNGHKEFHYRTSPIWCVWEWLDFAEEGSKTLESLVLNTSAYAHDWMSGVSWNRAVLEGRLQGILVVAPADLEWYYGKQQAGDIIDFIDREIQVEQIKKENL